MSEKKVDRKRRPKVKDGTVNIFNFKYKSNLFKFKANIHKAAKVNQNIHEATKLIKKYINQVN